MFKPAGKVKKSLKIAVYGEAGTGKSWFALQAQGKKAVIDTENGTDFYGSKFKFDVLKTRSYREVIAALEHIEKINQYDVLIIDPITNIYQTLKDAAQVNAEIRAKRKKMNEDDANLTFRDWGIVKNKFNSLISRLCNLPCHVVITGWQKDVYEGAGDNMRKVGTRPDADKKLEYQPDVIIRLEVDKRGNRVGVIEKDRTMTFNKGQRVKDVSFNDFIGSVSNDGERGKKLQTEKEAAEAEAATELASEETMKSIDKLWSKLNLTAEQLNRQLIKKFGTRLITPEQAGQFIVELKNLIEQKQQQVQQETVEEPAEPLASQGQIKAICAIAGSKKLSNEDQKLYIKREFGKDSRKKLTKKEAHEMLNTFSKATKEELAEIIEAYRLEEESEPKTEEERKKKNFQGFVNAVTGGRRKAAV